MPTNRAVDRWSYPEDRWSNPEDRIYLSKGRWIPECAGDDEWLMVPANLSGPVVNGQIAAQTTDARCVTWGQEISPDCLD